MEKDKTLLNFECVVAEYPDNDPERNAVISNEIINTMTGSELKKTLAFLIKMYKDVPNMLDEFWQRSSDACPLEASEHEKQLQEWEKWAYEKLEKSY